MPHQTIHTPMGTSTFGCSSQDQIGQHYLTDSVDTTTVSRTQSEEKKKKKKKNPSQEHLPKT
ncbi:hypothetical protein Taro_037440, partial [Colocasia esculenta]|nr:hypothetical protein [Colocasia esculenta]